MHLAGPRRGRGGRAGGRLTPGTRSAAGAEGLPATARLRPPGRPANLPGSEPPDKGVSVAELHVELVAVEREIWAGEADMVIARTTEGELGVLPGHTPLLGELAEDAIVRVRQSGGGEELVAAVHGGFFSVADDNVSILAEVAELRDEIDVARAQQALEQARGADPEDEAAQAKGRRAASRLRVAGQST